MSSESKGVNSPGPSQPATHSTCLLATSTTGKGYQFRRCVTIFSHISASRNTRPGDGQRGPKDLAPVTGRAASLEEALYVFCLYLVAASGPQSASDTRSGDRSTTRKNVTHGPPPVERSVAQRTVEAYGSSFRL